MADEENAEIPAIDESLPDEGEVEPTADAPQAAEEVDASTTAETPADARESSEPAEAAAAAAPPAAAVPPKAPAMAAGKFGGAASPAPKGLAKAPTPKLKPAELAKAPPEPPKAPDVVELLWQSAAGSTTIDDSIVNAALAKVQAAIAAGAAKPIGGYALCKSIAEAGSSRVTANLAIKAAVQLSVKPSAEDRLAILAVAARSAPAAMAKAWTPRDTINVVHWALSLLKHQSHRAVKHAAFVTAAEQVATIFHTVAQKQGALFEAASATPADAVKAHADARSVLARFASAIVAIGTNAPEVIVAVHSAVATAFLAGKSDLDIVSDLSADATAPSATATPLRRGLSQTTAPASSVQRPPWIAHCAVVPWLRIIVARRLLVHYFSSGRGDEMPEAVISFLSQTGATLGQGRSQNEAAAGASVDRSFATPNRSTASMNASSPSVAGFDDEGVVAAGLLSTNAVGPLHWIARASTEMSPARWAEFCQGESPFAAAVLELPAFIGATPAALWQVVPLQGTLEVAMFLSGLWLQLRYNGAVTDALRPKVVEGIRAYDADFGVRALIKELTGDRVDSFDLRSAIAITIAASVPGTPCLDLLREVRSSASAQVIHEHSGFDTSFGSAAATPSRPSHALDSSAATGSFATPARRTHGHGVSGLSASRMGLSTTYKKVRPELAHLIVAAAEDNHHELVAKATTSLLAAAADGASALMVSSVYSNLATSGSLGAESALLLDERAASALQLGIQNSAVHVLHAAVSQRALDALVSLATRSNSATIKAAQIAVGMAMQSTPSTWTCSIDPASLLTVLVESNTAQRADVAALLRQSLVPHLRQDAGAWQRRSALEWITVFYAAWPTEFLHELLPLVTVVLEALTSTSAVTWSAPSTAESAQLCFEIIDAITDDQLEKQYADAIASCAWKLCVYGGNGGADVVVEAASLVQRFERSPVPLVRGALTATVMKNGDGASLRNDAALLCHGATSSSSRLAVAAICIAIQKAIDVGMRLPSTHLERLRARLLSNSTTSVEEASQALLALVPTPNIIQSSDVTTLLADANKALNLDPAVVAASVLALRASVTAAFGSAQARALSRESVESMGSILKRPESASICASVTSLATSAWTDLVAATVKEAEPRKHLRATVGPSAAHPSKCPRTGLVASLLNEVVGLCNATTAATALLLDAFRSKDTPPPASVRAALSGAVVVLEGATSLCTATLSRAAKGSLAAVVSNPLLSAQVTALCVACLDLGRTIKAVTEETKSVTFVEAGEAPLALVTDRTSQLVRDVSLGASRFVLADINSVVATLGTGVDFFEFMQAILSGLQENLAVENVADDDDDEDDAVNASRTQVIAGLFTNSTSEQAVNRRKLCDLLLLDSNLWDTSIIFVDFALLAAHTHSGIEAALSLDYRNAVSTTHHRGAKAQADMNSVSMRRASSTFSDNTVDLDLSATSFASSSAATARDARGLVSATQVPAGHVVDWTAVAVRAVRALLHLAATHGGSAHHHLDHHTARLVERLASIVRHLLITAVVDVGGELWQREGLQRLLQFHDPGLRASSAVHASGSVTRLPWHHFWSVTLQLLRGSVIAAVASEDIDATRLVTSVIVRKLIAVSRIRFVVECPVTGPVAPERTQPATATSGAAPAPTEEAQLVVTPWSLEEGSITCDLVAKLTASRHYSPLAEELKLTTFLSAKCGLRDVQERRLEAIRQALSPFFARHQHHHHRTGQASPKRNHSEAPIALRPIDDNASSGSSSSDSEGENEVEVQLHRDHHHHLIMARLALMKILGASLALGPVLSPSVFSQAPPNALQQVAPPQHADLVAPRRVEKAHVSPGVLLEFVRSCFRVVAAITRSSQAAEHAETPLSRPTDIVPNSPRRKSVAGGSIAGGTAADTTLGVHSVEGAAQSIELAVIIFTADAQRWANTASVLRLKEFKDVAEQLGVLMQKARGDALEFASYADIAGQALQEVRELLTLQASDAAGGRKR